MTRRMRVNTDQILCWGWRWEARSAVVRSISVIRGSHGFLDVEYQPPKASRLTPTAKSRETFPGRPGYILIASKS